MDGSIRVSKNEKQIEVNDNGDCITLKIGDANFTNSLTVLMKDAQQAAVDLEREAPGDTPEEVADFAEKNAKMCTEIMARIDGLFGADTCQKVFGDGVPDFTGLSEFFSQIAALIKEFEAKRREESERRMAKYLGRYKKAAGDGSKDN